MFKFFNILFRISLIFLICLVWFRYFVPNFTLSILYTVLATIIIEIGLHFLLKNRKEKEFMKAKDTTLAEKIAVSFAFNQEQALNFYHTLAKSKHKVTKRSKYLIVEHKQTDKTNTQQPSKTILFPAYSLSVFMPQDLVEILSKLKKIQFTKLVVCTKEVSRETITLANQIEGLTVLILDKFDSYNKLMKTYNIFPENLTELKTTTKMKIKEMVAFSLNKKRSKGYFFASIILLFSSFIFRMNLYYVIMSSILLLLSLISYLLPKYNIVLPEEIL